jgi:hypothetical protein
MKKLSLNITDATSDPERRKAVFIKFWITFPENVWILEKVDYFCYRCQIQAAFNLWYKCLLFT